MLLTPGPVEVPQELLSIDRKMIHHRTKEYSEFYSSIVEKLNEFSKADLSVVLTGSGTLANEAMLSSFGLGKLLVVSNGEFGGRLYEIASIYQNADFLRFDEATGINYERIKNRVDLQRYDSIAIVENETSTACLNDVSSIAKNFDGLVLADSVSCWPVSRIDSEKVPIFTTASQKSLGIPPGLSIAFMDEEIKNKISDSNFKKNYYANLASHIKKYGEKKQNPTTPAITLLYALQKSLGMIDEIGMQNFISRHEKMSLHIRSRLKDSGFKILGEEGFYSPVVTAFLCENAEEKELIKKSLAEKGLMLANVKGKYSDSGLRIANMGFFEEEKIKEAVELICKK